MKFYGNGVVWDNMKSKVLCKFTNGEYETIDKYEIEQLIKRGYESDGIQQEEEAEEKKVVNYEDMTNNELRTILEERGHEGLERKNKKQLLELIEGE